MMIFHRNGTVNKLALIVLFIASNSLTVDALSSTSLFTGNAVEHANPQFQIRSGAKADITMRKQKASDRRTRRLQRGELDDLAVKQLDTFVTGQTIGSSPTSPMDKTWSHKNIKMSSARGKYSTSVVKGRGRSRKRSQLYNTLSSYHTNFLSLLTEEFRTEESAVRDRIEAAIENPIGLEESGQALFDLYPERRGNIFSDEVYRLVKAGDATTVYPAPTEDSTKENNPFLPQNHKFSTNDVVMLTLQPAGSGDFFDASSMPTRDEATSLEARVLNTGPTYVDIAIAGGLFEAKFGPAPNNLGSSGKGNPRMRLRADRYFSNVPYNRMVAALGQLTAIPDNKSDAKDEKESSKQSPKISFQEIIRQTILCTYGFNDPTNPMYQDPIAYDIGDLARQIARPPFQESTKLANQVLAYFQSNPQNIFPQFNGPQLSAIGAALTRRMTMIQGPPGTGKTTVAASIAFGYVHQCRSLPGQNKVLATAFSNVGADNLAEQALRLGLKVVRLGKPSAISPSLWDYTIDAAIEKDPDAQRALEDAAKATANLKLLNLKQKGKKGSTARSKVDISSARNRREVATTAVKASIQACNVAATKAMREADVIVCTSIGAADPRLLAACGMIVSDEEEAEDELRLQKGKKGASLRKDPMQSQRRPFAPDGLAPLSMPFVIIDEACQSVEPASLVPLLSTDSCRSVVMLGDPCQLPPTVISDPSGTGSSPLAKSLMSRLSEALPQPVIVTAQADKSDKETFFLDIKQTKQAISLVRRKSSNEVKVSYRRQYQGSLLLSVQYRMHPSISAFSSAIFYDGLLSTPSFLSKMRNFPPSIDEILPLETKGVGVRFINISGCNNERRSSVGKSSFKSASGGSTLSGQTNVNTSFSNKEEADQIISMLKDMMKNSQFTDKAFNGSIGIITPYSSQVALIKSMMASDAEFRDLVKNSLISIEVNSIDAYQGRERDVIIFSAVRSNRRGSVGFLSDWRRMNVALTRAKSGLIVFGDMNTLKGDKHWEALTKWCEGVGCLFDAEIENDECDAED